MVFDPVLYVVWLALICSAIIALGINRCGISAFFSLAGIAVGCAQLVI